MSETCKVQIIEDNASFRLAIEKALEKQGNFSILGSHSTSEVALRQLQQLNGAADPELILLDLNLPGMGGLDAMRWIREYSPQVKIIVLTQSDQEEDVLRAISQGAAGYLLKESTLEEIIEGIRTVLGGGVLLDSSVASYISIALKNISSSLEKGVDFQEEKTFYKELSAREMEVLTLLGQGMLKKEIAEELGVGFSTVATHIRNIYAKLKVENAPAAISKAYQKGLLK